MTVKANNRSMSIAITSGKGGVGKTNLALNLGYTLYKSNYKVLIIDCDLGLANLDVLLGVTPQHTLQDALSGKVPVNNILTSVAPKTEGRFDILPAASGVPELVDLNKSMHKKLVTMLNPLVSRYEFILLDIGAGITPTVQTFVAMAHARLMVITPEPTSLTDAYALMKVMHSHHQINDFHIVVNMIESPREEEGATKRIAAACEHFLGFTPQSMGGIPTDLKLQEAVRRQTPLMEYAPTSPSGKAFTAISEKLIKLRHQMGDELLKEAPLKEL